MKKKTMALTLQSISRLLDKKLDQKFDQKLTPIQRQLTNLVGETTYTRNEVNSLRSEMNVKFTEVHSKIDSFRSEMNQRFDTVGDQLQEVIQVASDITDQKLKEFKQKYLAA